MNLSSEHRRQRFARVVLDRLQKLAERIYPDYQCGFRSRRPATYMVFSLRQLQEKCREQNHPLYIAFIDITNGFDLMSRNSMFFILGMIACPLKLLNVIQSFHIDMKDAVQSHGAFSDAFVIRSGVRQGCVLVPTQFDILLCCHAEAELWRIHRRCSPSHQIYKYNNFSLEDHTKTAMRSGSLS